MNRDTLTLLQHIHLKAAQVKALYINKASFLMHNAKGLQLIVRSHKPAWQEHCYAFSSHDVTLMNIILFPRGRATIVPFAHLFIFATLPVTLISACLLKRTKKCCLLFHSDHVRAA